MRVTPCGATSEPGHPEDGEDEPHETCRDSDEGDDEQEDEAYDDESDRYANHRFRVPAPSQTETSGVRQACRTTSRSSVISRIVYAGPSFVLPEPLTPP
jgi:hypothetical protein